MGIQQSKKYASVTQAPDIGIDEYSTTISGLIATGRVLDSGPAAPPLRYNNKAGHFRKLVTFAPIEKKRKSRKNRDSRTKEPTTYPWDRAYDICQQKQ